MKTSSIQNDLRPAISVFLLLTIMTGLIYPLAVTLVGKLAFSDQAAGSLVVHEGKTIGSALIGQNFTQSQYFWGRLSATTPAYNTAASSGSNLGPLNPALLDAVKARVQALQEVDPDNKLAIPVDLVTASGSGLDPHISVAAANYQLHRVAMARHLEISVVQKLLEQYTEPRQWLLLGEPRVNVLLLNLALDNLQHNQ